jgi:hypothetical protein
MFTNSNKTYINLEVNAILLVLKFVASSEKSKFMICSDSLSCLLAIENCKTFILKIVEIYISLVAIGKHVIFTWFPSHICIHGNIVVDREAKNALDDPVSNCSIPYTDLYDIWSRLPVPSDFDRKNKESCQLGNVFRVICYEFAGPSYLANVLKYISL